MSSTENLLQESDKSMNALESGYQSDSNELDEESQRHKAKADKKKKYQRNVGLENKGFESDNENVNTGTKHKVQVHRTLSENANTTRETLTTKAEKNKGKRRHSYGARTSTDTAKTADDVIQNASATRRRSSSADEDLRRRACLNSMRLRRVSSSSQQPFSEVDISLDEDVFYDDDFAAGVRRKTRESSYDGSRETRDKRREYAMDKVCSAFEYESFKLDRYSRRLSFALEQRATLKEELNTLRRAASVPSLTTDENWKIASKIHHQNEKLNSLRRQKRGREDKNYATYESLRRFQMQQSRRLPDVPPLSFSSGAYEFYETLPIIAKKDERLPQPKVTEEFPQHLEEKGRNDRFHEETQPIIEQKVESLPQRNFAKESPQNLKGKDRNGGFFLSELEKETRERKIADLAADLWQKLLQGEKFQGDVDANHETTSANERDATTERGSSGKSKESVNSWYTKPGMREKARRESIAKLTEEPRYTTTGFHDLKTKTATLMRSESESNVARKEAFTRNQRRPVRYKRGSSAAETLVGTARSSASPLSDVNANEIQQVRQEETYMSRPVQPEKSNRFPQAELENLEFQSPEAVSPNPSKWFDYMLPPGKRGIKKQSTLKHSQADQYSQHRNTENPSSLQEKLRYYQELQEKRYRDQNSFDLADAYMAAQDGEDEQELRRQAAGKAAILRREASHLLYEAMNLERICDPNARVRHIFTPY